MDERDAERGTSRARLTHAAFQVADVERSVAFYRRYTGLEVVHERPDSRTGSKVVWLREPGTRAGFTLVIFKADDDGTSGTSGTNGTEGTNGTSGTDGAASPGAPHSLHHLGFALESRDAVDAIAARARAEGVLSLEPADHGEVVGYLCTLVDPDDNEIEFSHGQVL